MADDGMLLNFALPDDAFMTPKIFKGGNWKDRLTARKSAEWGRAKAAERVAGGGKRNPDYGDVQSEEEELIVGEQRPAKKARTTGDAAVVKKPKVAREPHRGDVLPKTTTGEVISSLFTSNPSVVKTAAQPVSEPVDETPVEPSNAPLSDELATFTNLGLSPTLANHLLTKLQLKAPTAIQRKAIQLLCASDTDAFIQAETGSGKTLAYLLPIVQRISDISLVMKAAGQAFTRRSGLFALILAPTRELSKQISAVLETLLSCCHWIVGGIVIGGEKKSSEKARLRKGVNILVATPGRLADHLDSTEVLDVSRVRWLVMDEGDRLVELGFEKDIQKIVSVLNMRGREKGVAVPGLPARRTTVLCSATIKADVESLRSIALKDPVAIAVDAGERVEGVDGKTEQATFFSAPSQLKQSYAIVPAKQRLVTLVAVLKQAFKRKGTVMKCIVFMSAADSVDFHFEMLLGDADTLGDSTARLPSTNLSRSGKIPQGNTIAETRTQGVSKVCGGEGNEVRVFRLHGSLQQVTRTETLKGFAKCETPAVLVCTDVMARGLDLPNVDLVVEYDPPASKDDHLHRIGRTARAGKAGRAMIFLLPGCEEGYVEVLKEGKPRNLTRHEGDELLKKGFAPMAGVVGQDVKGWEQAATDWQLEAERSVNEHPRHLEQARRAYQSHVRAYATHVTAERNMFDMKALHLGHLAKAFGLRDKPGRIGVPGQRPSGKGGKEKRAVSSGKSGSKKRSSSAMEDVDANGGAVDEGEARRKMLGRVKMMTGGASEFNLG
ncbi:ATP-dependent RNA helicase dbp7 [Elasticomyces elasticus]|nr:ATP-dependent RNA helicase dbp7 [Elasticomyces elasticus]KAK3666499.1 ATP-dependent RNA helicase dbp7 [Elasticomyces elasticus]KAK4931319.1 ATP-dependent RNA helicase dbp7 [Elasticomyces elasticus]KAK5767750.1 ATP-dependent RNA helicase dbp7 [Elasticomyces elasticus]